MSNYLDDYKRMDPPIHEFEPSQLGTDFPRELELVSRLYVSCGYQLGIAAYLNFMLLKHFIITHDTSYPPRFKSFHSMANTFYQSDLFLRDVTDSGKKPTGGISNPKVRAGLKSLMARHRRISIPIWMMTYFGFSLVEAVERLSPGITAEEKQLHLQYMAKTFRMMEMPFSADRSLMERFARSIESEYAASSPSLEKHARNIFLIGEMVDAPSNEILAILPSATRAIIEPIYLKVRPTWLKAHLARFVGRLVLKQAVGTPRKAVPYAN